MTDFRRIFRRREISPVFHHPSSDARSESPSTSTPPSSPRSLLDLLSRRPRYPVSLKKYRQASSDVRPKSPSTSTPSSSPPLPEFWKFIQPRSPSSSRASHEGEDSPFSPTTPESWPPFYFPPPKSLSKKKIVVRNALSGAPVIELPPGSLSEDSTIGTLLDKLQVGVIWHGNDVVSPAKLLRDIRPEWDGKTVSLTYLAQNPTFGIRLAKHRGKLSDILEYPRPPKPRNPFDTLIYELGEGRTVPNDGRESDCRGKWWNKCNLMTLQNVLATIPGALKQIAEKRLAALYGPTFKPCSIELRPDSAAFGLQWRDNEPSAVWFDYGNYVWLDTNDLNASRIWPEDTTQDRIIMYSREILEILCFAKTGELTCFAESPSRVILTFGCSFIFSHWFAGEVRKGDN